MNAIGIWILGGMLTALGFMGSLFFTLLWRRLDMLEKNMDTRFAKIEDRIQQLGDTVMEVKGRLDEISKHV